MAIEIRLPGLGESITEGTIVAWLKQPGDVVRRDEPLVSVSTDKVEVDVPSLDAGVLLEIRVPAGVTAKVGTVIGVLGAAGDAVVRGVVGTVASATGGVAGTGPSGSGPTGPGPGGIAARSLQRAGQGSQSAPASSPRDPQERNDRFRAGDDPKLFVSPVVRRLAREHDVDLSAVEGTGQGGRISRRDLEAFLATGGAGSGFAAPPGGYTPGLRMPVGGFARRVVAPFDPATAARYAPRVEPGDTVVPLSASGRAMAEHMAYTWWRAPHVSTIVEVDMAALSRWRDRHKAAFVARHGAALSFTACISWVVARTLRAHPDFNASLTADHQRILHGGVHLGVAVARPDGGLVVPVLRDAGALDLPGFARALDSAVDRVRRGLITPAELGGGTFTVTNVGSNGNLASMPLINQPQVAILATGAITKRVAVVTDADGHDAIAIRPGMYLTLTYDHRAVDGARSGRFLRDLRSGLEGWSEAAPT